MAYPTVSAPYGLRPINSVDGKPYAGATRLFDIDTNADSLYYGNVLYLKDGLVSSGNGGPYDPANGPVGVFVGCTYINPVNKQATWSQYFPAGASITEAQAYVVDDPMVLFQAVVADEVGPDNIVVIDTTQKSAIGSNMAYNERTSATSPTTGNSGGYVIAGTEADTPSLILRVIGVVPASKTETGYPELLVKLNGHAYNNTTGWYSV